MKKLLQDCLEWVEGAVWIDQNSSASNYTASEYDLKLANRIRTALASLKPDATPEEVILAQCDRLEDEGDTRAVDVRAAMAGEVAMAELVLSRPLPLETKTGTHCPVHTLWAAKRQAFEDSKPRHVPGFCDDCHKPFEHLPGNPVTTTRRGHYAIVCEACEQVPAKARKVRGPFIRA